MGAMRSPLDWSVRARTESAESIRARAEAGDFVDVTGVPAPLLDYMGYNAPRAQERATVADRIRRAVGGIL